MIFFIHSFKNTICNVKKHGRRSKEKSDYNWKKEYLNTCLYTSMS